MMGRLQVLQVNSFMENREDISTRCNKAVHVCIFLNALSLAFINEVRYHF